MWLAEAVGWLGYYLFPTETGRHLVRLVTLGQVHCEDDLAWWVGSFFWLTLAFSGVIGVLLVEQS